MKLDPLADRRTRHRQSLTDLGASPVCAHMAIPHDQGARREDLSAKRGYGSVGLLGRLDWDRRPLMSAR